MRSLLQSGAVVALGSDWFVTEPSPILGIYSAVTRRTVDGSNRDGLNAGECVDVHEALRGYTLGPAYAAREEHELGSIQVRLLLWFVLWTVCSDSCLVSLLGWQVS